MATYLLTWNPLRYPWHDIYENIQEINIHGYSPDRWSCGITKKIVPGDRVFLIKLGRELPKHEPRGIVASGWAASEVYLDDHWDEARQAQGKKALYVDVDFDTILDPQKPFPREQLDHGIYAKMNWSPQNSGITIPDGVAARLEEDWERFLGRPPSRELILYQDYSRQEVHHIFAPHTPFTPQSGTWGLHGIIAIPNRPRDFVFFVTYGQQQGEHIFDEGITQDGVLSWQSQPRQSLADPQIQDLVAHDELTHSIYLFLRTEPHRDYTYLGKLKYLSHDAERENPVYFQWQILDWSLPGHVRQRMSLELYPSLADSPPPSPSTQVGQLVETPPPPREPRKGTLTSTFRARSVRDFSASDAANRKLGLAGELLVIKYEKDHLASSGRGDLARRVRHVAAVEGDGAGYDIESFTPNGDIKYIEVKTTRGPKVRPFYMTANELEFARQHPENFYLCRVYQFDQETGSGQVYVRRGSPEDHFNLTPTQFRVSPS